MSDPDKDNSNSGIIDISRKDFVSETEESTQIQKINYSLLVPMYRILSSPIDVLRTRLQTGNISVFTTNSLATVIPAHSNHPIKIEYDNKLFKGLRSIKTHEGLTGLFKGSFPACLAAFIKYSAADSLPNIALQINVKIEPLEPEAKEFEETATLQAGFIHPQDSMTPLIVSSILAYPLEVIRTQMQCQQFKFSVIDTLYRPASPLSPIAIYQSDISHIRLTEPASFIMQHSLDKPLSHKISFSNTAKSIYHSSGILGLYRGAFPSILGDLCFLNSINRLVTKEFSITEETESQKAEDHPNWKYLNYGLPLLLYASFTYPLDTISKHMRLLNLEQYEIIHSDLTRSYQLRLFQTRRKSGLSETIYHIWNTTGIKGFWFGFGINCWKLVPATLLIMGLSTYKLGKEMLVAQIEADKQEDGNSKK